MKTSRVFASVVLVASAGVFLAACSGAPGPVTSSPIITSPVVEPIASQTPPTTTGAVPTTTSATAPKKSPRGNFIKALGEPGGISDLKTKKTLITFAVNTLTVDPPCPSPWAKAAENGHLVVLDVVAETTPELADSGNSRFMMAPFDFQFIGTNGTTFNGKLGTLASFSCLPDTETFPIPGMGPGEKVRAKVVLDIPAVTGILVFRDNGSSTGAGWEYTF